MNEVNQQQVLFRFGLLRAPQLNDKEKEEYNFLFHTKDTGDFEAAVNSRPEGQSVSKAMSLEAVKFKEKALSADGLRSKYSSQYLLAEWISRNKYSFVTADVMKKLDGVSDLTDAVPLWDNLFYQVITQSDYYAKDLIIELLILGHIQSVRTKLNDDKKFVLVLPDVMTSTSVLPLYLFPDEPIEVPKPDDNKIIFSSKDLSKSLDVLLAQSGIQSYETAISEVTKLQIQYQREYDIKYEAALKIYNAAVEAAYAAATPVEKSYIECPGGCVRIYYEYENLILPNFNFDPPSNVDQKWLQAKLSKESYAVIESLSLQDEPTYDSIIDGINAAIAKLNIQYYANQPTGQNIIGIGGMMFQNLKADSDNSTFLSSDQIPFTAYFDYTTYSPIEGKIQLVLDLGYTNGDAVSAIYTATWPGGSEVTAENFYDAPNGNMLNMTLFNSAALSVPSGKESFDLIAAVGLSDGTVIELECTMLVKNRYRVNGVAKVISGQSTDNGQPFIPSKFGIRRLGIGEYKKVVSEVCCYREAEVSHIINIMDKEFLSRTTTRERIEENTITEQSSTEKENLTDTTSSNRFEMQTEISKILEQDRQIGAYANVKAHGTAWSLDAGGNYATNNSKEESNRQAVTQATEVTQRAMERIVTKFSTEVVHKVTESYKEENSHIYDNRGGTGHVSGVYRFINAIYKNQIYNYGKRLMYEFMVPEPSRIYRSGMTLNRMTNPAGNTIQLVMPVDPVSLGILSASDITEANYLAIAAKYNAEVEAPLPATAVTGKAYQGVGVAGSNASTYEFKILDGYQVNLIEYSLSTRSAGPNLNAELIIGNEVLSFIKDGPRYTGNPTKRFGSVNYTLPGKKIYDLEILPISVTGWDMGNFSFTVTATLNRKVNVFNEWRIKTYDSIMKAYHEQLDNFNEQVKEAQAEAGALLESNPLFYREIERITLKRNCISYIQPVNYFGVDYYNGSDFQTYSVNQSQGMDDYASHAKFMEQAFEWDIMSYNFYPYYWGNNGNWKLLYQSDSDDPTFRSFMQSGMARVIVSVRPGFETAVMHYMKFGLIWDGGQMPVLNDPLYLAIVEELKEPEYTVEETWETVVPTSLIGIQKEGVLVDENGLPCGGGCEGGENLLKPNGNTLPNPPITEPTT